jgi:hypothetical protein
MSVTESTTHSNLVSALEQSDEMRRSERAERIEWLSTHQIPLGVVVGPMDSMAILGEARDCFIEGHYIASLLLCVAFIEHTITDELVEHGLARYGVSFVDAIRLSKDAGLFSPEMLSGADHLREIRNPFTHRKSQDHRHSFGNRFLEERVHPRSIVERDAKDALALMYAFFHCSLKDG